MLLEEGDIGQVSHVHVLILAVVVILGGGNPEFHPAYVGADGAQGELLIVRGVPVGQVDVRPGFVPVLVIDPDLEALAETLDKTGGDIAKIAVMPQSTEDVERIRALADKIKNGLMKKPYLIISMGESGKETRLDAGALGSVMTFGALTEKQLSAPGQVTVSELKKELLSRSRL